MASSSSPPIKFEADMDDDENLTREALSPQVPPAQHSARGQIPQTSLSRQRSSITKNSRPTSISERKPAARARFRNKNLAVSDRRVLRGSNRGPADHTTRTSCGNGKRATRSVQLPPPPPPPKAIVIGIDFGTTMSAFSYHITPIEGPHIIAHSSDVKPVVHWPGDHRGGRQNRQVPSEIWLSEVPGARNQVLVDDSESSGSEGDESEDSDVEVIPRSRAPPAPLPFDTDDDDYYHEGQVPLETTLAGYPVQTERYEGGSARDDRLRFERIKAFLFDSSQDNSNDKIPIRSRLRHCITKGIISKAREEDEPRDVLPVLVELMIEYFNHVKKQLIEHEGLTDAWIISFVLAVPISCWPKSSSWVLTDAVKAAIKATGLGTLTHDSIEDLAFVLEPEAAGYFCLRKRSDTVRWMPGDTFIIVDGGGGTVDLMTFTIENDYPLRLKDGGWEPLGDNCGASYLNINFADRLRFRIRNELIFKEDEKYMERVINQLVLHFETHTKREIDIFKLGSHQKFFMIQGLKRDDAKRFRDNEIIFNREDWEIIFMPQLRRTAKLLKKQFQTAISARAPDGRPLRVDKVCTVGGFCASPSLQSYLKQVVRGFQAEFTLDYMVELVTTTSLESVSAVASGAVQQYSERRDGSRRAPSSFGFLRNEAYSPEIEIHSKRDLFRRAVDGKLRYKVIDFFIQKDKQMIDLEQDFQPFRTIHTFPIDDPPARRLRCKEKLYVSDQTTKSGLARSHPSNRSAKCIGTVTTHFTKLRDEDKIPKVYPDDGSAPYYKIEYDIIPHIDKMKLAYKVRWPVDGPGDILSESQACIAAAFKPGRG